MNDAREEYKSSDVPAEGKMSEKIVENAEKEEQELLDRLKKIQKENFALRSSIKALKTAIQAQTEECNETELKLEEIYREIWTEREKFCEKADEFNNEYDVLSDWWQTQLNLVSDLENGGMSRDEEMKRMEAMEMEIEELQEEIREEERNGEEMEVHLDGGEAAIGEMLPTSESRISKGKEMDERTLTDLEFPVGEMEKKEGLLTSECNSEQVLKPQEKSTKSAEFEPKETNQLLPTSESNEEMVLPTFENKSQTTILNEQIPPTFEFESESRVVNKEKVMPTPDDQEMLPASEFPSERAEIKKKKGLPTSKKKISSKKTTSHEQQMLPTFGYDSENIMDGQTMSPTFEFYSDSTFKNAGKVSTTLKPKQTILNDERMLPTFRFKSKQKDMENKKKSPTFKSNSEVKIIEERMLPTYELDSESDVKNRRKMMPTLNSKLDDQRMLPTYEFGARKTDTEKNKGLPTSNCSFEQNLIDGENIWPTFEFHPESRAMNNEKMMPTLNSKQNTLDRQRVLPTSEFYSESSSINKEKMMPTLNSKLHDQRMLPTYEFYSESSAINRQKVMPTLKSKQNTFDQERALPTFEFYSESSATNNEKVMPTLNSKLDDQGMLPTSEFYSESSAINRQKVMPTLKQNALEQERMLPTSEFHSESSATNNDNKTIPTLKPKQTTLADQNTLPTFEYETKLKKDAGLPTSDGGNTFFRTPPPPSSSPLPTFELRDQPSSLSHSVLFSMVDVSQVREATRKFNRRKFLAGKFKKLTTC